VLLAAKKSGKNRPNRLLAPIAAASPAQRSEVRGYSGERETIVERSETLVAPKNSFNYRKFAF
jgi:hypothetical protein